MLICQGSSFLLRYIDMFYFYTTRQFLKILLNEVPTFYMKPLWKINISVIVTSSALNVLCWWILKLNDQFAKFAE